MRPVNSSLLARLLAAATLAIATTSVVAQEGTASSLSYEVLTGFGAVENATFKQAKHYVGSAAEFDARAHFVLSKQGTNDLLFRLGVDWQGYFFDAPGDAPIPKSPQSLRLLIGGDWQLGQAWLVRFEAQPGFYGSGDDFRWGTVKVPIVFGASYIVSSDLQLVAGISFDPDRKYVVLPGVGVRWRLAEKWVLNGVLPTPRIEFSPNKSLTIYAGADVRAETYRTAPDFGRTHGMRALDNAVVDYWQVRVGAGASWKMTRTATIEFEAGVVPFHEFDFHRSEVAVRAVETAPYLGIGFKAAF